MPTPFSPAPRLPFVDVVFIAFDGVQMLDVAGPMEVFAVANEHLPAGATPYRLTLGSPAGRPLGTHAGLQLGPVAALQDLPERIDTLVVTGGSEQALLAAAADPVAKPWLQRQAPAVRRVVGVCTGSLVLAAAGLLDGRRATTHWNRCALLQSLGQGIEVEPDAIFVASHPVYTSAGVTAGIDLCLALVEADHGAATALAVARELVLFLRRPGGQSQFSAGLQVQATAAPPIQALVAALVADPTGDCSVAALAGRVGMSERTFARSFRRETGFSPAQFVEAARVERAKALLESSAWPLARVAQRAGFASVDALQRAFMKRVRITPGQYRERFGVAQASGQVLRSSPACAP